MTLLLRPKVRNDEKRRRSSDEKDNKFEKSEEAQTPARTAGQVVRVPTDD